MTRRCPHDNQICRHGCEGVECWRELDGSVQAAVHRKENMTNEEKEKSSGGLMTIKKPTIHEIEAFMDEDEDNFIEILPNGECRMLGVHPDPKNKDRKPITMRENLGGEYALV